MVINNHKDINAEKLSGEMNSQIDSFTGLSFINGKLNISVSKEDEGRAQDVYDAHDPSPEIVYSITPSSNHVLAVVGEVNLIVTGEPDATITVYAYDMTGVPDVGDEYHIDLDENGFGEQEFVPPAVGRYVVRGKDGELAKKISVIEAVA